MKNKITSVLLYLTVACLVGFVASYAGSLTPPGSPANTMYSLTDIYNLSAGTTTTEGAGTIPSTPGGVASTGKTLTEVYTAISDQIALLANNKIAKDITAFGYTGTLYGDTDPSKVLTTATYAGTAVAGYIYGATPLKTNALCYNANGTAQNPCLDGSNTDGGQDGYYQEGTALSYTDNGDGTISDNATGLMWKKCSEGKTGVTCATGANTTKTWTQALAACEADTTGGYTDWRLPNINELFSIVDHGRVNPSINSIFNSALNAYWSSTAYQWSGANNFAWNASFVDGDTSVNGNSTSYNVRCVR